MDVIKLSEIEKSLSKQVLSILNSKPLLEISVEKPVRIRCNVTVEYIKGKFIVEDRPSLIEIRNGIQIYNDRGMTVSWAALNLGEVEALMLILYEKYCGALSKIISELEEKRRRIEYAHRLFKDFYAISCILQQH